MNPAAVRLQSQEGYLISVREPYSARAQCELLWGASGEIANAIWKLVESAGLFC
jgi:hypothetical protein